MTQNYEADNLRAQTLFADGHYAEAAEIFRMLATAVPQDANPPYNCGVALAKLGRFEEALGFYRTAITLNPSFANAYVNFAFCLSELGLIAQARQGFAIARSLAPDDPVPMLNESITALALGDYVVGWQSFSARWRIPGYDRFRRSFDKPDWRGENLNGKVLFLYAEQGFGDSLQMARYLPILVAQAARVIVGVPPALAGLMRGIPGIAVIVLGDTVPDFDFHAALMDIPAAMGTLVETIPADVPYLHADAARIDFYRRRLPDTGTRRIGLAWAGRSTHGNDHNRSLALAQLAPLFGLKSVTWVSLQKLVPDRDKDALRDSGMMDWGQEFADFADAAAAVSALDLVITIDSAMAHLAGSLGKDVWVLLPFSADWRWMIGRTDSPWYPTARLFRQDRRGDWAAVIGRVAAELGSFSSRLR